MLRTLSSAIAAVAMLATAGSTQAYVLAHDASGSDIRWPSPSVSLYFDPTSLDVASGDALAAAQRAASHWGASANVQISITAEVGHGQPGYDPTQPAQNRSEIFFVDGEWDLDPMVVAETLVTTDATTHEILDADLLLNEAQHRFAILPDSSVTGTGIDDDLESTLTHEMGHAIGLAHNLALPTATMYPMSEPGEVSIRTLSSDDIAGAEALYDNGNPPASATPAVGCSAAPGSGVGGFLLFWALALVRQARRFIPAAALLAAGAARAEASPPKAEVEASGVVREARSEWRGNVIVTHITLEVGTCYQGRCSPLIDYEQIGGRMGGVEQQLGEERVPCTGQVVRVALRRTSSGLRPIRTH